jgi:imidazole glycerol phosphate synthase glutamine amidotransferase subunit
MKKIAILDYGSNNLKSVDQSIKNLDFESIVSDNESKILDSDCLIIPGVGSFKNAMNNITSSDLQNSIYKFYKSGRLIIGICLGMQILFESSEEFGITKGLGFLKGEVSSLKKITTNNNLDKIPNTGWKKIYFNENLKENTFSKFNDQYVYFVHSFFVKPKNNITLFFSDFSQNNFCASIISENIIGFQFHPEKSGHIGQKMYQEICSLIK